MFIEAEDRRASLAFIAADPFECGEPIMKAVREDVDLGILPGNKLAVQPDLFGFLNRHTYPASSLLMTQEGNIREYNSASRASQTNGRALRYIFPLVCCRNRCGRPKSCTRLS